jgi:hypothetical protein
MISRPLLEARQRVWKKTSVIPASSISRAAAYYLVDEFPPPSNANLDEGQAVGYASGHGNDVPPRLV